MKKIQKSGKYQSNPMKKIPKPTWLRSHTRTDQVQAFFQAGENIPIF